ncbi:MAG: spore germination protein [Lachnospiraceae bacterium]|uniref:spore germination protein n=1 Tax=Parablautia sp. Marseille-Q6255 TaxID=3039593 RepID=UPI0024BC586F|nr:spore germination protein [Parablautia sp. Marseille-Q6255]
MSDLLHIGKTIFENRERLADILPIKESFDLIQRDILIGNRQSSFYFIDGMIKDEVMLKLMDSIMKVQEADMPPDATAFSQKNIPYVEVDILGDYDQVLRNVLSGVLVLFIDGYSAGIAIDCRTYPARSVDEPDKDKSLRGSKDGFVETVVFDTALIRRRIRDPHLVMEMLEVGSSSRSDVVLCYMKNLVNPDLLDNVRSKIEAVRTTDLCMNQQSLAEALIGTRWYNPFPKFKFSERPDTAAACIMEGKVAILVDNSPAAMILPTSVLDMIEEANDYYFPAWTSVYLKISRVLILLLTVFLTPVFLLLMNNPQWIPASFEFIAVKDVVNIPLVYQLLILELAIDGLRLAALNTPNMLSTPLSVFAGLVLGEFAVRSGWFNAEVMLYMAFVSIANYTQPNFELGYAVKFMRMILLVLTAVFDWVGFLAGCALLFLLLFTNRTLSGRNYMNVKLN